MGGPPPPPSPILQSVYLVGNCHVTTALEFIEFKIKPITVVPELIKISHFFSYLSDSKNQTIIDKVLLANDGGNQAKQILIRIFRISDLD